MDNKSEIIERRIMDNKLSYIKNEIKIRNYHVKIVDFQQKNLQFILEKKKK